MAESRGRKQRVQKQKDVNGEAIVQRPRPRPKPEVVDSISVKPKRPIKKGKIHRALQRVIKKMGISPTIRIENKLSQLRTTRQSKVNRMEKITVSMTDLSEHELMTLMNDATQYTITAGSSGDFADCSGWKMMIASMENGRVGTEHHNPHKHSLGNSVRMYSSLDYEKTFRKKNMPITDKIRTNIFLMELKKELTHPDGILIGNKAFKEKKFNSRVEGRI